MVTSFLCKSFEVDTLPINQQYNRLTPFSAEWMRSFIPLVLLHNCFPVMIPPYETDSTLLPPANRYTSCATHKNSTSILLQVNPVITGIGMF